MGYSTKFQGILKFSHPLTSGELKTLSTLLKEDVRDHPEWGEHEFYYIDLCFDDSMTGLIWTGAEKTYNMDDIINFVLQKMRESHPTFGLYGIFKAQGEDIDDRYFIVVDEHGAKCVDSMSHRQFIFDFK